MSKARERQDEAHKETCRMFHVQIQSRFLLKNVSSLSFLTYAYHLLMLSTCIIYICIIYMSKDPTLCSLTLKNYIGVSLPRNAPVTSTLFLRKPQIKKRNGITTATNHLHGEMMVCPGRREYLYLQDSKHRLTSISI